MKTSFAIKVGFPVNATVEILQSVTCRVFREREWPEPEFTADNISADMEWVLDPSLPAEGFRIETGNCGNVRLCAPDARGLFYGMGKFMRRSSGNGGVFDCCLWRGTSVPRLSMRGMYFATHFHNYYQEAPIADVEVYVEDLALLGYNALTVWYDMHAFEGIDDPAARIMLSRLNRLLQAARRTGMSAGLTLLANEGYRTTPDALRAVRTGRAHYGVEVCVSAAEGELQVLSNFREEFEAFRETGIDYICLWPYDQGGCSCEGCRPWGANGMLRIGQKISKLFKDYFPSGRVIFSTWLFDHGQEQGEWRGLAEAFDQPPQWVDYLMADSHDRFPRFPLESGIPGRFPLVNFPEISMYGMNPWGGFGANPLIRRFSALWGEINHIAEGGFPYSEGIFEDINKVAYAAFYWSGRNDCREMLEEYVQFAFGSGNIADCHRLFSLLESNHGPVWMTGEMVRKWGCGSQTTPVAGYTDGTVSQPRPCADVEGAREALELCSRIDAALPVWGSRSWRWRLIKLRAFLDYELIVNGGQPTDSCQAAFTELQQIYHAQAAEACVAPPVRGIFRQEGSNNG